jgi:hypothetical protein
MTLQELFYRIGQNPDFLFFYFIAIPVTALLLGFMARGEGHVSPWKFIYATLIYLVSVPGIFAVCLNIYFFLFQRGDILQTDIYLQVLPILVMILTVFLIRRNVDLKLVPGFDKISALWMMMFATFAFMWFIDRMRIVVFSYLPFQYLLGIFVVLFLLIYVAWRRFVS